MILSHTGALMRTQTLDDSQQNRSALISEHSLKILRHQDAAKRAMRAFSPLPSGLLGHMYPAAVMAKYDILQYRSVYIPGG